MVARKQMMKSMGPRHPDFDKVAILRSPSYAIWCKLKDGEKMRYAGKDYIKGLDGYEEERFMRAIDALRRYNRDRRQRDRARFRKSVDLALTTPPPQKRQRRSCTQDAEMPQEMDDVKVPQEMDDVEIPQEMDVDTAQMPQEMDVRAVEASPSYQVWMKLQDGEELICQSSYIKGFKGDDWELKKNIWRLMGRLDRNDQTTTTPKTPTPAAAATADDDDVAIRDAATTTTSTTSGGTTRGDGCWSTTTTSSSLSRPSLSNASHSKASGVKSSVMPPIIVTSATKGSKSSRRSRRGSALRRRQSTTTTTTTTKSSSKKEEEGETSDDVSSMAATTAHDALASDTAATEPLTRTENFLVGLLVVCIVSVVIGVAVHLYPAIPIEEPVQCEFAQGG